MFDRFIVARSTNYSGQFMAYNYKVVGRGRKVWTRKPIFVWISPSSPIMRWRNWDVIASHILIRHNSISNHFHSNPKWLKAQLFWESAYCVVLYSDKCKSWTWHDLFFSTQKHFWINMIALYDYVNILKRLLSYQYIIAYGILWIFWNYYCLLQNGLVSFDESLLAIYELLLSLAH